MDSTQISGKEVIFFFKDNITRLFAVHVILFGVIIAVTLGTTIIIQKEYWPIMCVVILLIVLSDCLVIYLMEKLSQNK